MKTTPRSIQFYRSRIKETKWPTDELCNPPTPADICMNTLIDELLPNWYVTIPENQEQVNTAATFEIIKRYVDYPKQERWVVLFAAALGVIIGIIVRSLF